MAADATSRAARRERADERRRIAEARKRAGRDAPWRRGLRMARRGIGRVLTATLLPPALGLLARSWRVRREGVEHFDAVTAGGAYVAVMWHGRMLLPIGAHRGRGIGVLVSPSGDGAIVAMVLRRFGYVVVRGSSSRYGSRALREMREHLDAGTPIVVTPDGPRGPRHAMNVGVSWLAREAGVPILPLACVADRAWHLKSWDRFTIPKPFARVALTYGAPIRVQDDADDTALERISVAVSARVLKDELAGFEHLGVRSDHPAGSSPTAAQPAIRHHGRT